MKESFALRSYSYCELAMLYFPNGTKKSASVQLRRWIIYNKQLEKELASTGVKRGQRVLTPKQVEIIVNALGMP